MEYKVERNLIRVFNFIKCVIYKYKNKYFLRVLRVEVVFGSYDIKFLVFFRRWGRVSFGLWSLIF